MSAKTSAFGTILITKDRNWCLERTMTALKGSELLEYPLVIVNNGSTREDPMDVLRGYQFRYADLRENLGIVGARVFAHRIAKHLQWDSYCFLQDDFEMKMTKPWLSDTLHFMKEFNVDYCRLTTREGALVDEEHWVKGVLRIKTGAKAWNCSHIQLPKSERINNTSFALTDKHYSDWVHIMRLRASSLLFELSPEQLSGPTVTDLVLNGEPFRAFYGSIRSEFDVAVKLWLAYSGGLVSATGLLSEKPCWCGAFDHFTGKSTCEYRDLPPVPRRVLEMPIALTATSLSI